MALAWVAARRVNNAGWVDVAWTFSFLAIVGSVSWLGEAPLWRKVLLIGVVAVWSLRLGLYLAVRVGRHTGEDPRYAELRKLFGPQPWGGFLGFFMAQAALAWLLALPFFSTAANSATSPHPLEIAGVLCWCIGLLGESAADRQLAAFRACPENRGKVCDIGLWRYSRHPNYFFEWVVWVGFALLGQAGPAGWLCWIAPAVMLILLTKVSGIPPAEAQSLRSRGDLYRAYQQRTSAFVPWFPQEVPTRVKQPPSL
jgi:steroid 5-alpha reductase family enzyme